MTSFFFLDYEKFGMFWDNQVENFSAVNPIFHNCHLIWEIFMVDEVITRYISSKDQVGDIFT